VVGHRSLSRAVRTRQALAVVLGSAAYALLTGASAAAAERSAHHALIGRPAPDFVQHLFTGPNRNFRLSEHRGEVVVLGFWTSWCGSCRAYLQRLGKLDATYTSAGLVVVGVCLDDGLDHANEFAHAVGVRFRNSWDGDKQLGRRYAVGDVPLTLLIDREGVVRYAGGELDSAGEAELVAELRHLLDE
jgi:thiol-disulfide isomerase/thioredoxin